MRRYFVMGRIDGTPYKRYAVVDGEVITHIYASRPDGVEVERPDGARIELKPLVEERTRVEVPAYGTVKGEALERARKRAGEKGRRAMAERRRDEG